MLNLRNVDPVVLSKKMFEYLFSSVDGRRKTNAGRIGMAIAHYSAPTIMCY